MERSVLVFVSHASEDKESYIEPIIKDLEECYIRVWIDRKMLIPGQNLKQSILRDGLDKADVALIFFTQNALKSSWVDREIKHVLRDERSKGNDFDLSKVISIYDSEDTYEKLKDRFPELTDDLLHLMPADYSKIQLGQLVSAIWSKYLSLQGGDVETQRQLLAKDKEIFQKEKEILELVAKLDNASALNPASAIEAEFEEIYRSGRVDAFIQFKDALLTWPQPETSIPNLPEAIAFALLGSIQYMESVRLRELSEKGRDFFKWVILKQKTLKP